MHSVSRRRVGVLRHLFRALVSRGRFLILAHPRPRRDDGGHREPDRAGAPRRHLEGRLQADGAQDGHHKPGGLRTLHARQRNRYAIYIHSIGAAMKHVPFNYRERPLRRRPASRRPPPAPLASATAATAASHADSNTGSLRLQEV